MIYIIVCYKTNSCKIGFSDSPENRLAQLQTGNPFSLELLAVKEGNINDETLIHSMFKKYRLSGEWFQYCDEIKIFFGIEESILVTKSLFKKIKILSNSASKIYFSFVNPYSNGNLFQINTKIKNNLKKELHISNNGIKKGLEELVNHKLILKYDLDNYIINPRYSFKGSISNRNKALKAIIELGCKDC